MWLSYSPTPFADGAGDMSMCIHSVPLFRGGDFLGIATADIPRERGYGSEGTAGEGRKTAWWQNW